MSKRRSSTKMDSTNESTTWKCWRSWECAHARHNKAMMKETEPFPIHSNNNRVRRLRIRISSWWILCGTMARDCCDIIATIVFVVVLWIRKIFAKPFDDPLCVLQIRSDGVTSSSLLLLQTIKQTASSVTLCVSFNQTLGDTNSHPIPFGPIKWTV